MNDTAYFYEVFYIVIKKLFLKHLFYIRHGTVCVFVYVVLCSIPMILENNKIQLYRKYRAFAQM